MRRTQIAAGCVVFSLCVTGTIRDAHAQTRLQVLTEDTVPGASGLRMLTIRDNQLGSCFTVFTEQPAPAAAPQTQTQTPPAEDEAAKQGSIDRIQAAAQDRDRKLADLNARQPIRPSVGPASLPDARASQQYESERQQIDDEFENVVRSEIVGSFPWSRSAPGQRTGSFEDQANAIRRGTVDPDPTSSMHTMSERLSRIEAQLASLAQAPRLAASGPFPCPAAGSPSARPRR